MKQFYTSNEHISYEKVEKEGIEVFTSSEGKAKREKNLELVTRKKKSGRKEGRGEGKALRDVLRRCSDEGE